MISLGRDSTYLLVRWYFLKLLGFIYLLAFASYLLQLTGLVGSDGILPAGEFLETLGPQQGIKSYFLHPTLAWFSSADSFLLFLCWAGLIASILLIIGMFPGLNCLVLWLFYLSLVNVGGVFFAYPWDYLLLEVGFLAMFLCPRLFAPTTRKQPFPSPIFVWLYRLLLFRVIFSAGLEKYLSGDSPWRNLTALEYYLETQPLPTWIAWYLYQLPSFVLKLATLGLFAVELVIPFLFFFPRKIRLIAFFVEVGVQICIYLTGNFGYFNLLIMVLCIFLLEDGHLLKVWPKNALRQISLLRNPSMSSGRKRLLSGCVAALLLVLNLWFLARLVGLPASWKPLNVLLGWTQPLHLSSDYRFPTMKSTVRDELVIERSYDRQEWFAYEFKWKPGDLAKKPAFVAPHQPRLDWQMHVAALGKFEQQPWLHNLVLRLLENQPQVLALFAENPFAEHPPRYLRIVKYRYRFTLLADHQGDWWERKPVGYYSPVLSFPKK